MKECLICPSTKEITKCKYCGNEYCKLHYEWHIENNKICRKEKDKDEKNSL